MTSATSPAKSSKLWDGNTPGDRGDVSPDDARENELSVREGFRILSSYRLASGVTVWIITEADRSATTLLLPEDY